MFKFQLAAIALLIAPACYSAECKPTVEILPFEVVQDYSKSYQQLQDIGLANNEVGLVKATAYAYVSKDKCTVIAGYKAPVLYVAKELKKDQCSFDHVQAHEQEHVAIYEAHLKGMQARIEQRIQAGEDKFEAAKTEVLAVYAKHKEHDSDEEYEKNTTACNGSIKRLALR